MNACNIVYLAALVSHCFGAKASRTSGEEVVMACFGNLESTLLAHECKTAQDGSFSLSTLETLHNLHAINLLDAKRVVHESLMFWSEMECCRIAKIGEIEAERRRLNVLIRFLKKLGKFVFLNKRVQKEDMREIKNAQRQARRCWYRLMLIAKHSSIGEASECLSRVYLCPDTLLSAIHIADNIIKLSPNLADCSHSSISSSDTDSEDDQSENYSNDDF